MGKHTRRGRKIVGILGLVGLAGGSAVMFWGPSAALASTPAMSWSVQGAKDGVTELSFYQRIDAARSQNMFYFGNQFGFTGGGAGGYIGMQPQPEDSQGARQFRVIFSSFRADSATTHPHCHGGADGSPDGVSCKTSIKGVLGHTYRLQVAESGTQLTGTVIDTDTGESTVVGRWSVGAAARNISTSHVSWVERYTGPKMPPCNATTWPYYKVKFGNPTANNGALTGSMGDFSQKSSACPGALRSVHDSSGTTMMGGFKGPEDQAADPAPTATPARPTSTATVKPSTRPTAPCDPTADTPE
ncbi:hypothetical protein [Streptomyces sp. CB03911]|uniref:DUF3472 domain-containing protein n=1 Tax=Streptomyces sp. CB03911 TaxID=1804758 RepID=UPI00093C922A|nr:hypothetical protein [Streptomyces sp. CB03911]OKI16352.1 hypothetical protein A6A07_09905 [Streptomyces sp. CB03911]